MCYISHINLLLSCNIYEVYGIPKLAQMIQIGPNGSPEPGEPWGTKSDNVPCEMQNDTSSDCDTVDLINIARLQ